MPRAALNHELEQAGIVLPPKYLDLGSKVNELGGAKLPDETVFGQIAGYKSDYYSQPLGEINWQELMRSLKPEERGFMTYATRAFLKANRYYPEFHNPSIDELNNTHPQDLLELRKVGPIIIGTLKVAFEKELGYTLRELLFPGTVEELVKQGRIPTHQVRYYGGGSMSDPFDDSLLTGAKKVVVGFIPPERAHPSDIDVNPILGGVRFVSQAGEKRGPVRSHFMYPVEWHLVEIRRNKAIKEFQPEYYTRMHPLRAMFEDLTSVFSPGGPRGVLINS